MYNGSGDDFILRKDYDFIDKMNTNELLEYLINEIILCVLLSEYELNPKCKRILSNKAEDEIKKNIKLAGRQLHIADMLIIDDINKRNLIDKENLNLDRFKFLDEKEIIDGIRYIAVAIIKVQTNISKITEETENRVRNRLKSAYGYIENINNLCDR